MSKIINSLKLDKTALTLIPLVNVLDGVEVNLISRQHLKINKNASGRHEGLADLEKLP